MPRKKDKDATSVLKLNNKQVDALKGKLVKVKRVGAHPIFVEVAKKDTIETCLSNADVPTKGAEIKLEAIKEGERNWKAVKLSDKAVNYKEICVTTKVRGSF